MNEKKSSLWRQLLFSPYFRLFAAVSALWAVLSVRFWMGEYAYLYLDVGADTMDINYPLYCLFSEVVHGGGYEAYFLNTGLGMDMSSYLYQYLNPLNLLVILLPQKWIPWGILLASYLKLLLTGLFGYAFFVRIIRSEAGSFAAALVWTFSGYMMLWGQHYGFAASIAMFTVFLYLVQRYVSEEERSRNAVLVLWITLMLFTNYYFLYMSGLMGALYVLVYLLLCRKSPKVIAAKLLGLAGMGALGICIGGTCLVSTWNIFQDSIRAGTVALEAETALRPYSLSWLLGFLARLFSNNAMGIGNAYTGPGNYYEIAMLSVSVLVFPALIYLLAGKKTRKGTACLLALSLLLLAMPLTGKLFTMNSAAQRWSFLLCLEEALAIGMFLRLAMEERDRRKLAGSVLGGVLAACLFLALLYWGEGQGYYELQWIWLGLSGGFLAAYALWLLLCAFWDRGTAEKRLRAATAGVLVLLCAELAAVNFPTLNFRENPTRNQLAAGYYNDGTREAAHAAAAGEEEPYRIAKTYESASENDGMAQDYPGLSVYLTTVPRELIQLRNQYGAEGISINFADFDDGNDLRSALLGVKYLLALPEETPSEALWQYAGGAGGKNYYTYRGALPFGYLYDSCWDREDLQDMDETERILASFAGFHFGGEASDTAYPDAADTPAAEEIRDLETAEEGISLLELPLEVHDCGAVQDEAGIRIEDMGEDPYLVLEDVEQAFGGGLLQTVTVQAEVAEPVDFALYYQTEGDDAFSQDQICIFTLSPEEDTWSGTLPPDVTSLRLDVSTATETAELRELRVNACEELNAAYGRLRDSKVTEITWEDSCYRASVENDYGQTGMLCVPFLYSRGWHAYLDGEPAEIYNVNSGLTGIEIPEGSHEVLLEYRAPGREAGLALSLAGLAVYAAVFAGKGLWKRKRIEK